MLKILQTVSLRELIKLLLLGALISSAFLLIYVILHELRYGIMRVVFLDIGQGDSIFIESPTGNQILIDGGPPTGELIRRLGEVLPFYDHSINLILETHTDIDHSGGLPGVINSYEVDGLIVGPGNQDNNQEKVLLRAADMHGLTVVTARRGQVIDLGGGAILTIISPQPEMASLDTNSKSIVLMLTYGTTHTLLMADVPQSIEHYIMSLDGTNLRADILKNGHHGSKTSSAIDFIALVDPQYAILSVGKNNKYGHPNKETLDTLNTLKIPYLRTDELGKVEFTSDGNTITQVN